MNVRFKSRLPWALAFSFARAIQQPALEIWRGQEANVLAAQQALFIEPGATGLRAVATYDAAMEMDQKESAPRADHLPKGSREHPKETRHASEIRRR